MAGTLTQSPNLLGSLFPESFFPLYIQKEIVHGKEGGRKEGREKKKKEKTHRLWAYALGNSLRLPFHCNCLLPPNFISMFPRVTMLPDNIFPRFCLFKMTGFSHVYIHVCGCVFTVPRQVQLSKKEPPPSWPSSVPSLAFTLVSPAEPERLP